MLYNTTACVGGAITLYILSCISLILRVYVRLFLLGNFALDDYLAIIATVMNSVLAISYILGVLWYSLGSHIPREDSQPGLKVVMIGSLFYFLTTYLAKLSFIFTLFRIVTKRSHSCILHLFIITGAVITVFAWFWVLFFCEPVQFFWEQLASPGIAGSCKAVSSLGAVLTIHAVWVLLADLTLGLVLPVLILWNSQLPRKMKASVYLLLGIGLLASIATIVRLTYLPLKHVSEPLIAHHALIFWSVVEAAISIICSAGVTIKPLMVRLGCLSASRLGESAGDSYTMRGRESRRSAARVQAGGKEQQSRLEGFSDRWYMMAPRVEPGLQTRGVGCLENGSESRIVVHTEICLHRDS
ncbi:hypothetical protein BJY01DRAFT_249338 [Aspergillus pseudoustus]|uniref:Rhodopsin domain-containing protein n=1 Tax=Aspergillus pseudoustus TaxID=1810923 RepID=A0ABR4JRZ6_9EURO